MATLARRALIGAAVLSLWGCNTGVACAQVAQDPVLTADIDAYFSVRPPTSSSWTVLTSRPTRRCVVPPQFQAQDCMVRADSGGWFVHWTDERHVSLTPYANIHMNLEWHLGWAAYVALAGTGALALFAVAYLFTRKRMAVETERYLEEEMTMRVSAPGGGWFPANGALPKNVGDYEILSCLGAGGMGVVYKARRDGNPYALKIPLPHVIQNETYKRRFIREATLGARLRHPRLVRIEALEGGIEHPYIVMEFVEGRPLSQDPVQPGSVRETLAIGAEILEGLACIHEHGMIHRDLKPANVMRTEDGHLKLIDFGIMRDLEGTQLTTTGNVIGTPEYMAPEQLQGGPVDARVDLYALGMILYKRLVADLTPMSEETRRTEIAPPPADAAVDAPAPRAPRFLLPTAVFPISMVRTDVPPAVEATVMRLIEHHAARRYATANDALDAVRKCLDDLDDDGLSGGRGAAR